MQIRAHLCFPLSVQQAMLWMTQHKQPPLQLAAPNACNADV